MNFKVKDHYFKKAKKDNYLARSVYKLEEINNKYSCLTKKDIVLDLGYHPGSWTQYISKLVGEHGLVYGIDIRPINKKLTGIPNVKLFKQDIFELQSVDYFGLSERFDVVVSDMAPNTTGIKSVDQNRSLALVEDVITKLPVFLRPGGNFIIKVFDSNSAQSYLKSNKGLFKKLHFFKPKSTRSISKEFFVIGVEYNP